MAYETLLVSREGPLTILTLNRPERLNSINDAMASELPRAMNDALCDDRVRGVLLTGAGRGFCAGADLKNDRKETTEKHPRFRGGDHLRDTINPMLLRMTTAPKPVVAAVNGPTAGVGCGLALAADIVLAARSAVFFQAFVRVGLAPDGGSSWLLPRLVGRARAAAMMMLGEKIDAQKAADLGLVHQVYEDDALLPAARNMALLMANGPTVAYALIKRVIEASATNSLSAQLALEAECQDVAFQTADAREGIAAFSDHAPHTLLDDNFVERNPHDKEEDMSRSAGFILYRTYRTESDSIGGRLYPQRSAMDQQLAIRRTGWSDGLTDSASSAC